MRAFAGAAQFNHLEPRFYQLDRDREFAFDFAQVTNAIDEATVLAMTNSPHNPTGALLRTEDCAALAHRLSDKGVSLLRSRCFDPIILAIPTHRQTGIDNVIVVGDMSRPFRCPVFGWGGSSTPIGIGEREWFEHAATSLGVVRQSWRGLRCTPCAVARRSSTAPLRSHRKTSNSYVD